MKLELLDLLSKAAGVGGICIGIYLIIISKILKRQFIKIFPVKTAAFMVMFTVTLTFSLAALGLLVWVNSDMKSYEEVINDNSGDHKVSSTTNLESRAETYTEPKNEDGDNQKLDAIIKLDIKDGYKSTNYIKSKTEVETERKETEKEKYQKSRARSAVSSISISFLNGSFTIVFVITLIWFLFIASCFYYNKVFVLEIKE